MRSSYVQDRKREQAQDKARNLRFQRPIAKELNFAKINEELWEIQDVCSDVRWITEDEQRLERAFDGNAEQAWEFRLMFTDLDHDCGRMRNEINALEVWDEYAENDPGEPPAGNEEPSENVPSVFDLFFPSIDSGGDFELWGYDTWENDYYGLTWYEGEAARKFARKKIMRLTKEQLLDVAGQCLRIARQYLALKYRYDCMKAALDILMEEEATVLKIVQGIEEAYEKAEKASEGFTYLYAASAPIRDLDKLLAELPDQFWIE